MTHSDLTYTTTPFTKQGVLARSTALTSAFGAFCVLAAFAAPERAEANCNAVKGGGTRSNDLFFVSPNSTILCDTTGTASDTVSIVGKDIRTPADGLQLTIKNGATQLAPTNKNYDAVISGDGSSIVVENGGTMEASQPEQEGIRAEGKDIEIRVQAGGQIIAQAEAIEGNRFGRESDGLKIENFGTIQTKGNGGDAVIRMGVNSRLDNQNGGQILRTVESPSGSTNRVAGVSLGNNSYFTNRGKVELNVGTATKKVGDVVRLNRDSTFDNFGMTKLVADGRGNLVAASGDVARIVNRASGVLDAQLGARAIDMWGDQNSVINYGTIVGSDNSGVAIRSVGELFSYTQIGTGNIRGDVQAYAKIVSGKPREFPDFAFLEFRTDASTYFVQDKDRVEFFGFSDIVLKGPGNVTLEQDFVRGEARMSDYPTGHFKKSLTLEVDDPKGTMTLSGQIQDQPNQGGKATVYKDGEGTLRLTGDSTFTGAFKVEEGLVTVDGSLKSLTDVSKGAGLNGGGEIDNLLLLQPGARVASDGKVQTLSIRDLVVGGASGNDPAAVIEVDSFETGGSLSADRIVVKKTATFGKGSFVDVVFKPDASTLPALQGITIVDAQRLTGMVPSVRLDPKSLPNGHNFTLDLEADNISSTGTGWFGVPGETIQTVSNPALGALVLQVKSFDVVPTQPAQITVINKPTILPTSQQVVLTPTKTKSPTQPSLVKGTASNVTTPVVSKSKNGNQPKTGIKVNGGSAQVAGTVTPTHVDHTGKPTTPGGNTIGNTSNVVATTSGVTGTYNKVDQKHAGTGGTHRLSYQTTTVSVSHTPTSYGNLAPLGQSQTKTQKQVGNALTSALPDPHARAKDNNQQNLVNALYPLTLGQINPALDSIAGINEDPTFVTVLNTRELQDAMDSRLRVRRDGSNGSSVSVTLGAQGTPTDRTVWGEFLGQYQDGEYLNDSEIRTWGLVLGADQTIADNTIGGVALSYSDADIDTGTGSSDEVRSFEAAAYAGWSQDSWFVNGNVGLSYNWLKMNRRVSIGSLSDTLKGEANAPSFFTGIEAGKVIPTTWGAWEPTAGLRYQYVDRDSYTESGPDGLARDVSSAILHTGQGILGVRAYGQYRGSGDIMWRPEIRVAYGRELGDSDIDGSASLVSAPGTSFDVFTAGPGEDIGILGLRLDGKSDWVNFYADYQAETRESLFGHRILVGFEMSF